MASEVIAIPTDVRSGEAISNLVEASVEHFGRLDIVVPKFAGDSYGADVISGSDESWHDDFDLYALSVIRLARAAVPHMRKVGGGSITNISSCGVHGVIPEFAMSEVIRLATSGFAKYLSLQAAPDRIRVNSILPGWIEGEAISGHLEAEAQRLDAWRENEGDLLYM